MAAIESEYQEKSIKMKMKIKKIHPWIGGDLRVKRRREAKYLQWRDDVGEHAANGEKGEETEVAGFSGEVVKRIYQSAPSALDNWPVSLRIRDSEFCGLGGGGLTCLHYIQDQNPSFGHNFRIRASHTAAFIKFYK